MKLLSIGTLVLTVGLLLLPPSSFAAPPLPGNGYPPGSELDDPFKQRAAQQSEDGVLTSALFAPSDVPTQSGARPLLIILVDFDDYELDGGGTRTLPIGGTNIDYWVSWGFGSSPPSIASYFAEVSTLGGNSQLTIVPGEESHGDVDDGVIGWIHLGTGSFTNDGQTFDYNVHPSNDDLGAWSNGYARKALAVANDYVDFEAYDTNEDGYVGYEELLLIFVFAGYDASSGGSDEPYAWPHVTAFWSDGPFHDEVRLCEWHSEGNDETGTYAIVAEWLHLSTEDHQASIGQAVHELGHQLFLPEGYDSTPAIPNSFGDGYFDVMGYGSWNGVTISNDSPAHFTAWAKSKFGWADVMEADSDGTYVVDNLSEGTGSHTVVKITTSNMATTEYFLVENRQNWGYDAGLPNGPLGGLSGGDGGLLIWHIDERVTTNDDSSHYYQDVEEASGTQHLALDLNPGQETDFYRSDNASSFTSTTVPNSNSYDFGDTGVTITNISATGSSMDFDLEFRGPAPTPTVTPTPAPAGGGGGGCQLAAPGAGASSALGWLLSLIPLFGAALLRRRRRASS